MLFSLVLLLWVALTMPTAACALNHAEHMESLALALPLISRQSTSSYNVTQIVASLPAECAPACTPTFTTLGYCEAGDADRCRQICAPANITALDACFDCFTKAFPLDEDTKAKLAANIAALKAGCSGSAANATSPAPSVEPTTGADDTNTTSAANTRTCVTIVAVVAAALLGTALVL